MDTSGLLLVGMLLLGFSLAGAFLITMTLGAVKRLRELPRTASSDDVEARLGRIEAAVDAIRVDVDRLVEHQRLSALPGAALLPGRADGPKSLTPH
jgi:hypothetical protein